MYTVKQLAEMASVSVRTLHYYDEIGLLKPSMVGQNQYRYYDEAALLRLQQIMFYRELGVELGQIQQILDNPTFNLHEALRDHRSQLEAQLGRLHTLIDTIDHTLEQMEKDTPMSDKRLFKGFDEEKQQQYEREIRLEYGADQVNESIQRWGSYTAAEKQRIMDEGNEIYSRVVSHIDAGNRPESADVQALIERWHQHLRYFYEPTLDILRGLPELYTSHPDFITNFAALHAGLGEYLKEAILCYVDDLETREIERLYHEDAARNARLSGTS